MKTNSGSKASVTTAVWASAFLAAVLLILARDVVYPVRALLWHAQAIVWWAVIIAAALGQGTVLVRRMCPSFLDRNPLFALSLSLGGGLGLLSLETFLVGVLGMLSRAGATLLLLAAFAAALLAARREMGVMVRGAWAQARQAVGQARLPAALLGLAAAASFPFVLVPNRAFDALSYHLEVPMRYLQAGGVVDLPENLYSYVPLLTEMLYALGLGVSGVALTGLIYYLFFVLTLTAVWSGGASLFGQEGAAWAAALTGLTPLFLMEVPQAGSDWSMTFFVLSAVLILAEGERDSGRMLMAAVMAGMAAGCRHQALGYAIVIPLIAGPVADYRLTRRIPVRSWGLFLSLSAATASPWYIKNLVMTGDPVYPLFASLLGRTDLDVGFVTSLVGSRPLSTLWSWAEFPVRAVFDPLHYSMSATIGVLLLALLPLLFCLRGSGRGSRFLLLWALFSFAAWYLTFRTARYAMPIVAAAYLWIGSGLQLSGAGGRAAGGWVRGLAAAALIANLGVFVGLQDYVNRSVGAALGTKAPERYLRETYNVYPAIEYLNTLDPPPAKVLFLGEMRGFYSAFPREVPSHNVPNRLIELARAGLPADAMGHRLREAGFSHILFHPKEWDRMAYSSPIAPAWKLTGTGREALQGFLDAGTRTVFSAGGVSVLEVLGE